jgi:hypothetical protein
MIFKKILKGTDLTFDIDLEQRKYGLGETVKGTISLSTEKGCKARNLMLLAEGKETTLIRISESSSSGRSNRHTTTRTYSETNTFFSEDLSHFLKNSISCNIDQDGTLEISPQKKKVAFDFVLPNDTVLLSSYEGKHASITYIVKATLDMPKKLDVNKQERFYVTNSNKNTILLSNIKTAFDRDSQINTIDTATTPTTIESENDNSLLPATKTKEEDSDKGSYSTRFEQIFGKNTKNRSSNNNYAQFSRSRGTGMNFDLGTIFAKGREQFLKENTQARINLLGHNSNVLYSPGDTIKGELAILLPPNQEGKNKNKIREMKITLNGIEHAFAQGLQRVSTIEKYEKKIELDVNRNGENNADNISFEFQIPKDINQSYIGEYSEYFWGLEIKLNIAWSSDVKARTIVEII